jgi:hypothetical protein
MARSIRIGNAQAFWGDRSTAAAELLAQEPGLDFLTLDYLAEVSMSILASQRERDPSAGFPRDFVEVVRSLAPYWRETDIRSDIRIVNPCPDEIAKLKAAGLTIAEVDPKVAFTKDVGVTTIQGVPILFGYNARADLPEDVIYKMVSAFYKNREELAKADPGFTPMAKDFIGMQVNGIGANPEIPVHPGLAKFLKEQKAWKDNWKVAS